MEVMPGYKQTEVGLIPEDWGLQELQELLVRPATYGVVKAGAFQRLGVPMVRGGDIKNGKINLDLPQISPAKSAEYERTVLRRSDVVISLVGYPGETAVVPNALQGANISRAVGLIRPGNNLLPDFLVCYLNSPLGRSEFLKPGAGSAQLVVNLRGLNALCVLLPPTKAEQEAIAQALSDADALMVSLEHLIAKKRHLKQGAMQELLTGKTRLSGFSGEWVEKAIEEIAYVDSDNLGAVTDPDYRFHYISLEDVEKGTLLGTSEIVFRHAPSRARRRVRKGDVLFGTVRPNLQSHCIIRHDVEGHICSTGFAVLRCREGRAIPEFVFANLFADNINHQIERLIAGSNYPAVNSGDVKALRLHSPEPEEQQAIAAILSDMDAEIAALEAKLAKTHQIKQGMVHNLLTGRIRLL